MSLKCDGSGRLMNFQKGGSTFADPRYDFYRAIAFNPVNGETLAIVATCPVCKAKVSAINDCLIDHYVKPDRMVTE